MSYQCENIKNSTIKKFLVFRFKHIYTLRSNLRIKLYISFFILSKKFLVTGGAGFIGSAFIRHIISNTDHYIFNIDKLSYASNFLNLKEIQKNKRYSFAKIDVSNALKIRAILKKLSLI